MRCKLLLFSLIGVIPVLNAQQRPIFSQYVLNNYIINPAVAGIENYWNVNVSYRQQWVGLDGAPTTSYITIHGPLTKDDIGRETATTIHPAGLNPRGKSYVSNYEAAAPHIGLGATVIQDETGPLRRFSTTGTMAYHLGITARMNLSAGLSLGFQQVTLDVSKLNFGSVSPVDPIVGTSNVPVNTLKPDFNVGLWLYGADYFLGASMQNALSEKLIFYNDSLHVNNDSKLVPHYFFTTGYKVFMSEDISLIPSVLLKYAYPAPVSIDVNAKFQYRDNGWIGVGYRYKEGFVGMLGLNIANTISVGYAYDYVTSPLNLVSKGSHEIMVGFVLGNKWGDTCPKRMW